MSVLLCPHCEAKTAGIKGKRQRYRQLREGLYRYLLRECRPCDERYCFRQMQFVNEKTKEIAWLSPDWVDEQLYHTAQEVTGEERIGSTASEYSKRQAKGIDLSSLNQSNFSRLTKRFLELCDGN